jgi:RNA polymerase sigma-70 factor (ECF subfamily)
LDEQETNTRFEQVILPHLDAAYNLARWLTANDHDAQDVVQEACLRALKFFGGFRGGNGRSWLLTIVRNTCYTWLRQNRPQDAMADSNEELANMEDSAANPDLLLARSANAQAVREALEQLPTEFREMIVLRELEGLSYKEIADVSGVPIGTVMSRLARGRKQLQQSLVRAAQVGDVK